MEWRKSSYSGGGNCVEVTAGGAAVRVRDSQDPHGPSLAVPAGTWAALTRLLKDGTPASRWLAAFDVYAPGSRVHEHGEGGWRRGG